MVVLHVTGSLGAGGAEALLYRLSTRPSDIEHHVITLRGRDWYSSRLEEAGVSVHHLNIESESSLTRGLLRLRRLMMQIDPDVIQTWMYRANLMGGVVARSAGFPVIWGIHHSTMDTLSPRLRAVVRLGGILARWVPDFVINCSTRAAEVHDRLGYSAAAGAVIHNGYDPAVFYPDAESREATRRSLEIGDDVFLVGAVARWHIQKDLPTLFRALQIARDRGVPLTSFILGNLLEETNEDLRAAIEAVDGEDFIRPLGRRSDVPELVRAFDVHVLSSFGGEAFPNVIAETMLAGTPNVSTDVGDAAMMVGETGWVVPPRKPEQLAEAIEQAYHEWKDSPEDWQQRRADARERIVDNFTFEKMASAYEKVWRELAAQEKRRAA